MSDGLVAEIERVIFESHEQELREGAHDFDELRAFRTARYQQARDREAESISDTSDRIAYEFEKEASIAGLQRTVAQKTQMIDSYRADLAKLVVRGSEAQALRHTQLGEALQTRRNQVLRFANQRRAFLALQDEVTSTRATKAPELLRQAMERHQASGLSVEQWDDFLLIYKGEVDERLVGYIRWADGKMAEINGTPPDVVDPNTALIADGADLNAQTVGLLQAEMTRLEALVSADRLIQGQYAALAQRIAQETGLLQAATERLTDAQGAAKRRRELQTERDTTYGRVFDALLQEESALADLYAPLMARLGRSTGTLSKLGFSVRRIVDAAGWAQVAEEELLDRRKSGPFQGKGALTAVAMAELKPAWETGSVADVQAAMAGFIDRYMRDILVHAPFGQDQLAEHRAWLKRFAHWLFATDHISIRYEVLYDGIDIRKLSPGTRGIVLLLLYLALDDADDRPLIIDQPEENLDPKSVFDELVALFVAAKARRQVIMVTHNANLVINTDADQVIVAEAGPHVDGGLPPITYWGGGLENAEIRRAVCDILEGGEDAFRERARRLRVRLER